MLKIEEHQNIILLSLAIICHTWVLGLLGGETYAYVYLDSCLFAKEKCPNLVFKQS